MSARQDEVTSVSGPEDIRFGRGSSFDVAVGCPDHVRRAEIVRSIIACGGALFGEGCRILPARGIDESVRSGFMQLIRTINE